jgi:peptidoglycan hydrolase-like protein with peptidoglycan-binding domain
MNLQGRNTSLRMRGEDVKLLQTELGKLGYRIAAPEASKQVFGASTRQAVADLSGKQLLEA